MFIGGRKRVQDLGTIKMLFNLSWITGLRFLA